MSIDKKIHDTTLEHMREDGSLDADKAAQAAHELMTIGETVVLSLEAIKARQGLKQRVVVKEIAAKADTAAAGQGSFISFIDPILVIDDKVGAKATAKMTGPEYNAATERQIKRSGYEVEKTRRMVAARDLMNPLFEKHQGWLVEDCEAELARQAAPHPTDEA